MPELLRPAPAHRSMPRRPGLAGFALVPIAVLLVAACSAGASPSPGSSDTPGSSPTSPPGSPSEPPVVGPIDHPTGSTDVVLRFEEGGGFVPVSFIVTQAPIFTLYGDGTVLTRAPGSTFGSADDGIYRDAPFRVGKLSEDQIQALLDNALLEGGLGRAKARYDHPMVADAPTATFTVHAGGLDKVIEVYALGFDDDGVPDRAIRASMAALGERLRDFETSSGLAFENWTPDRYRGVLIDEGPLFIEGAEPIDWPWPDIAPEDFTRPGDDAIANFPQRTLSPAEVAALGVADLEGGAQGFVLRTADGTDYTFALRPLLPDEDR